MPNPWYLPAIWVLNGSLAVLYTAAAHWYLLVLAGGVIALYLSPQAGGAMQRRWLLGSGALLFAAAWMSMSAVGALAAGMILAALAALRLEQFNPRLLYWRVVQGLGLYGLIVLGVLAYHALIASAPPDFLSAGQGYLEIVADIALYAYPLGFLAMLAQAVFAHPPVGRPEDLITTIRTRGKD